MAASCSEKVPIGFDNLEMRLADVKTAKRPNLLFERGFINIACPFSLQNLDQICVVIEESIRK